MNSINLFLTYMKALKKITPDCVSTYSNINVITTLIVVMLV